LSSPHNQSDVFTRRRKKGEKAGEGGYRHFISLNTAFTGFQTALLKIVDGIEHSLRDRRFSVHATKKVVKQEKVVPVENHRLLHLFTGRFEKVSWMDMLKITKLSGFVSGSV
jgi:ATP-dependent protease Clp ATPase subunit